MSIVKDFKKNGVEENRNKNCKRTSTGSNIVSKMDLIKKNIEQFQKNNGENEFLRRLLQNS